MPTPDTKQGIDLPNYGDAPAVPDDISRIYYANLERGLPRFANTAARDAAYPSPTDGQFCWVDAEKAIYVGRSGWQLFTRTAAMPSPSTSHAVGTQSVTATTAGALPTGVSSSLTVAHPMVIEIKLSCLFGTGTSFSGTVYGVQLTLSGSGAGVTLTPDANQRCLSGVTSPLQGGTYSRQVVATAAGTLNVQVFGHLLTAAAGSATIRSVELTLAPVRWI